MKRMIEDIINLDRRTAGRHGQQGARRKLFWRTIAAAASPDDRRAGGELPVLLTIEEAARTLRISRWKLYDYIHSRQLKTIKLGSRRVVSRIALQALIDQLGDQEALR